MNNKRLINNQIRDHELTVIDENGTNLGKMSKRDALNLADERGYDLVLINPARQPGQLSIAKIADYGKMLYEQKVKERQSKKKQNIVKVKEIKVKPQIAENDLKWMAKNATNWLNDGNQVKFKIKAYGRIGAKQELITETYDKFLALLGPIAKVQSPLKKVTPVLYEATIIKNK